jgi:hypothetical protein
MGPAAAALSSFRDLLSPPGPKPSVFLDPGITCVLAFMASRICDTPSSRRCAQPGSRDAPRCACRGHMRRAWDTDNLPVHLRDDSGCDRTCFAGGKLIDSLSHSQKRNNEATRQIETTGWRRDPAPVHITP